MNVCKIIVENKDGSIHYIDSITDILLVLRSIPPKLNWKASSKIEALHNKYFLMLTELVKNTNMGYNKTDLHEAIKPLIFGKFKDFTTYFKNGQPSLSTKDLTHSGWVATIDQLKVVANDIFNYTFI